MKVKTKEHAMNMVERMMISAQFTEMADQMELIKQMLNTASDAEIDQSVTWLVGVINDYADEIEEENRNASIHFRRVANGLTDLYLDNEDLFNGAIRRMRQYSMDYLDPEY